MNVKNAICSLVCVLFLAVVFPVAAADVGRYACVMKAGSAANPDDNSISPSRKTHPIQVEITKITDQDKRVCVSSGMIAT